ncbi:GTP cyclohydrolase I type 1 [Anaerovibrio sp. JC8]|uniref:GTP cyclohydrolase I FolE n=1 Tax=Anaerovibrio sp. JC8 TaxID=1240085 RepID=UPI000A0EABC7|nr:GTP cyclohydrolase I FolE [Anaerovibrio sp. JC8]ORU00783.1 GTP cyclohydrolase I type 1 [Anaerovibrio sp. JC8]
MNKKAVQAMQEFLEALGVDLKAAGMEKTPERVAGMYEYLFNGINAGTNEVWGELFKVENEGIVAVRDIPFYSMCEHHLVPFFGRVSIAYKPHEGFIAGFSKFTRMVEIISHRPQLQERMTEEVATAVEQGLKADGVLVIVEAQQLCMTMRGDMAHGTKTITSSCRGLFKDDSQSYHQAWSMLGRDNNE